MPKEEHDTQEQIDRWKRLLTAINDLAESKRYVESYIAFADTITCSEAYGALGLEMAQLVENALLSYGLISYARPFVQSRGGQWTKVPGRLTSNFTREERQIHNYVLKARKKLIAHSDFKGFHTHSVTTEKGDMILSVRPVPIVIIQGEDDSLNLDLATKRSGTSEENTLGEFRQLIQDIKSHSGAFTLLLREDRMFDVDIEHCNALVGMIDKVNDAISEELGSVL